ncbi:MAG: AlpA family phage regulatory protein [Methylovulum sp.]|nr:AlpA family phage regulatory protein [Methylovulum sp.]
MIIQSAKTESFAAKINADCHKATVSTILNEPGFLRIWEIIGDKKRDVKPILPIGRSTFLKRVKDGLYPAPVRISERTVAWRKSDISALIAELDGLQ